MGASIYGPQSESLLCQLNSSSARKTLGALNPSLHFEKLDVERVPVATDVLAREIVAALDNEFRAHEASRETSIEFQAPGPSAWRSARHWAQQAVDRNPGAPLPPYERSFSAEPASDHVSFALGVALGRLGANGEGILSSITAAASSLPSGIFFLDGTLDGHDYRDSLGHECCKFLVETWTAHGAAIDDACDLRSWLRTKCFNNVHKGMYENRPIHWPLSSEKKTFVAWINIHRWDGNTLKHLLADHLRPALTRLDGALKDLDEARDSDDKKTAREAERRFAVVQKAQAELVPFMKDVEECSERGPPPTDAKCTPRERDARYVPDLDDGVMINSAALWPLLEPQWKDPKKWWKELANAAGKKDYDWSHLAARYFPTRVDAKCKDDPSLGVAHGCFWKYHPARAWAWELRLQDEIGADFRIEEQSHVEHRARYLQEHAQEAIDAVEKEALRRARKHKKPQTEVRLLDGGLWSVLPDSCWALEMKVTEKQGAELHLLAPDEPKARKQFLAENPAAKAQRDKLLSTLEPLELSLGADDDDAPDDIEEEDEEAAQ